MVLLHQFSMRLLDLSEGRVGLKPNALKAARRGSRAAIVLTIRLTLVRSGAATLPP